MSAWPLVNPSQTRMEVSWPFGDFGEDRQETACVLQGGSELRVCQGPGPPCPWRGPWHPSLSGGIASHGLIVGRQTAGLGAPG